ncbi:MAG: TPM domain-containing protein [Bacteroidetes bacterium]|nr:TPM domain-containing protein [Bacteroidota bacterium]
MKIAEKNTSGEIRVRIEEKCGGKPLERAIKVFSLLKMERTKDRNGVLLYIALSDKQLAIIGDKGINSVLPKGFWQSTVDKLKLAFSEGQYAIGIQDAVLEIGERLLHFFPYQKDDINELSDDISFEKLNE